MLLGTLDPGKGPLQAESLAGCRQARRHVARAGLRCDLGGATARPGRGYSIRGACQMRRVLSVSPHGAGFPGLPAALPKLR